MSLKVSALFVSALMSFAVAAQAAVCFDSPKTHAQVKPSLPPLLRTLPLMVGTDSTLLAAIKIYPNKSAIMLDGYVLMGGSGYHQKQQLAKACVEGKLLRAEFVDESGSTNALDFMIEGNKIVFSGYELTKLSAAQFKAYADRVTRVIGGN